MGVSLLALARYTLKGPYQAAGVVTLLVMLSVLLPLIAPRIPIVLAIALIFWVVCQTVASALVGLIILTQGSGSGLKAIGVSIVGITLIAMALINAPELGISIAMVQWLPIILLAQVLRSSKSLSLTLLVGVVVGTIAIAAQYLLLGDFESQWVQLMTQLVDPAMQQNPQLEASYMEAPRWLVSTSYLMFVGIVLIARWMQSGLAGSKGFGQEFRSLALGKPAAVIAMLIVIAEMFISQNWVQSLGNLAMSAFLLQGLAILHSKLVSKKSAGIKLGLFYVVLFLIWKITMPLTAITGMADNWLGLRKKPEDPGNLN